MQMYEVLICYGLHMKSIFGGAAVRIVRGGEEADREAEASLVMRESDEADRSFEIWCGDDGGLVELKLLDPGPGWVGINLLYSMSRRKPTSHSLAGMCTSEIRHGERCARRPTRIRSSRTTSTRHDTTPQDQTPRAQHPAGDTPTGTGGRGGEGCWQGVGDQIFFYIVCKVKLTITASAPASASASATSPLVPPTKHTAHETICIPKYHVLAAPKPLSALFHCGKHGSVYAQTPAIRTKASLNVSLAEPPRPYPPAWNF
jgi:hypothetical protein